MAAYEPLVQSRVDAWQALIDSKVLLRRNLCIFGRDSSDTEGPIHEVKIVPGQSDLDIVNFGPVLVFTRQWFADLKERRDEEHIFGAFFREVEFPLFAWSTPIVAANGEIMSRSDRNHRFDIRPRGVGLKPKDVADFPMKKSAAIPAIPKR